MIKQNFMDIGHSNSAFSHLGEKILNNISKEEGAFRFKGNSNKYITIDKNNRLKIEAKSFYGK